MQKASSGAASQLPSSFPQPAHGAERLERNCGATAQHSRAAEAGVLKDVTRAPFDFPLSAPLLTKPTCAHAQNHSDLQLCTETHKQACQGKGRLSWRLTRCPSCNSSSFCWKSRNQRYGQAPSTGSGLV